MPQSSTTLLAQMIFYFLDTIVFHESSAIMNQNITPKENQHIRGEKFKQNRKLLATKLF